MFAALHGDIVLVGELDKPSYFKATQHHRTQTGRKRGSPVVTQDLAAVGTRSQLSMGPRYTDFLGKPNGNTLLSSLFIRE